MFKNISLKTLYNLRFATLGWVLAVVFVTFLTMVFYKSFSGAGVDQFVNQVPDELKSLIGSIEDFKTIPGYIGQQVFGPNVIAIVIIMAVLLFVGISVSEEDRGQLQTLLTFPLSRSKVYFQKLLAVELVIAVVVASIYVGIWVSLQIINESADSGRIWESIFAAWLMSSAYGLVAYAFGMFSGRKGLTVAVASGYAFISFLITSLAPAIDQLKKVDKLSIFHYYNNPQIMSHGLKLSYVLVLLSIMLGLILIGWLGFLRRDVKGD